MKTLIVYYSRTNTTKKIAEQLAKQFEADIEQLIDLKNRDGMMGYIMGGKDGLQEKLTSIRMPEYSPASYDLVVIGTPVWAGKMSPAVRTYIKENQGKFPQLAFFATQGAQPPRQENVFLNLEELCGKKAEAFLHLSTRQVVKEDFGTELGSFVGKLKS